MSTVICRCPRSIRVTAFAFAALALHVAPAAHADAGRKTTPTPTVATPSVATPTTASHTLDLAMVTRIDAAAAEVLASTGAPSVSIAVVRDGQLAYTQAYGHAKLAPNAVPARPAMLYAIGSISKQFTAAALLLLQQEGKLSLDDKVATWFPELTRSGEITLRQLLSHTSGYQDYWPQDYMFAAMKDSTTPEAIARQWAQRPLDYEPGTRWQYSNTGYVIAGRIVEKVSGMPLQDFLTQRIFVPLGMASVTDFDAEPLAHGTVAGYESYALGPPRPTGVSGPGWLFAAGHLAMTAADLARWDISLLEQRVLRPESYRQLETETLLANGTGTDYGLGLDVLTRRQRRVFEHGGEVTGFTAINTVYPDDRTAIIVLSNQMASKAPEALAARIADVVFERTDATDAARTAQARAIYEGLQAGRLDRALFTANANGYFSTQAVADFQASLAPLGAPEQFRHLRTWQRGGMTGRSYEATYPKRRIRVWTYEMPDGRLEQYQVQSFD